MKIAFICPYPLSVSPSQRFRFEHYLKYLPEQNIWFDVYPFINQNGWKILYTQGQFVQKIIHVILGYFRRFATLQKLSRYDLIYIHREAEPLGFPVFAWALKFIMRKKIHFDLDDAIWLRPESGGNRFIELVKYPKKTLKLFKWANSISGGNEYLCEKARRYNNNVYLIPTVVDTQDTHNKIKIHQAKEKVVIGWTGSHTTLQYLKQLQPVLASLEKITDFTFLVIANKPPEFTLPNVQFLTWNKQTEIDDLLKIDIGVMPLTDDLWANGKCGFKAIQYMSLGIPTIASDVGVNNHIIDHSENGFVDNNLENWIQYFKLLISQHELRSSFGFLSRQKIIDHYSVESQKMNFFSMLKSTES